jgi:hypothetical protein
MAISQVFSGAYTSTYNAVSCDFTRNGYELEFSIKGEMINESDAYGDSLLDYVYRGGNCGVIAEYRVANSGSMPGASAGNILAFFPWCTTMGQLFTAALPIGRRASDVASAFVMTATANTPTASRPATLTASKAIVPPDANLKLLLTSKSRSVPMRLSFLPSESGSTGTWFSMT